MERFLKGLKLGLFYWLGFSLEGVGERVVLFAVGFGGCFGFLAITGLLTLFFCILGVSLLFSFLLSFFGRVFLDSIFFIFFVKLNSSFRGEFFDFFSSLIFESLVLLGVFDVFLMLGGDFWILAFFSKEGFVFLFMLLGSNGWDVRGRGVFFIAVSVFEKSLIVFFRREIGLGFFSLFLLGIGFG